MHRQLFILLVSIATATIPKTLHANINIDAMRAPAVTITGATGPAIASDGGNYNGLIPYNGGPVISQVRVVIVYWGNRVDPNVRSEIPGFYFTLVSGSFIHFVSEYSTIPQSIGSYGAVAGAFTIQPLNGSSLLLDGDIPIELSQQIARGALPTSDSNTVYMVHLPPGISIKDPSGSLTSCVDFCGYHSYSSMSNGMAYAVLPDQSGGCAPGPPGCNNSATGCCGDKSAFEDLTMVASHELMETITDPQVLTDPAWYQPFFGIAEVGDFCGFARLGDASYTTVVGANGKAYQAQRGLSDAANAAGIGPRGGLGCVDYPTTLCCMPAADPGFKDCSWLPNGVTACPNGGFGTIGARINTMGGFGSASVFIDGTPLSMLSGELCNGFLDTTTGRDNLDVCMGVQANGIVEDGLATVVPLGGYASCFRSQSSGACPAGATPTEGEVAACCGPFVLAAPDGTLHTTIPGVPLRLSPVPATSRHGLAVMFAILLGLGTLALGRTRRLRS